MPKPAQVAIVIMRLTIRVLARERAKLLCACPGLRFVLLQDTYGLLFRAGDNRLYHQNMVLIKQGKSYVSDEENAVRPNYLLPTRWPA